MAIRADGPIRASAISASPSGESASVRFSQDEQFRAGYLAMLDPVWVPLSSQ